MSKTILDFAKSFVAGRLSVSEFANSYMELWKIERDNNILQYDHDRLSECLSTIFCLADLYNQENDRESYELDESQLRTEIEKQLAMLDKTQAQD
jgi:hypothetical protein